MSNGDDVLSLLAAEAQRLGLGQSLTVSASPEQEEDEVLRLLAQEAQRLGVAPGPAAPARPERTGIGELGGFAGDVAKLVSPIEGVLHPKQSLQRKAVFLAGIAQSPWIEGLANLIDLPEVIHNAIAKTDTEIPVLHQMSSSLMRLSDAIDEGKDRLIETGNFSPEELRNLSGLGAAIGYIVPGVMAYKGAGLLGKAVKIVNIPMAKDATAGLIFGLGTGHGDLSDRTVEGMTFAAFGGVLGMMMHPSRMSLAGYMGLRAQEQREGAAVLKGLRTMFDPETGIEVPIVETAEQARILSSLSSEVHMVATTPGGRRVLEVAADHRAYAGAIDDMLTGGRTHGVIQGVQDLVGTRARIQEMFPDLKVQTRPTGNNVGDIIVGRAGLNRTDFGVWAKTGHFPGQRVTVMGTREMEFVNRTAKKVALRDPKTGNVHFFDEGNVTFHDVGAITPSEAPPGALLDDFMKWHKEHLDALGKSRDYDEAVMPLRDLPDNLNGSIVHPSEGGLGLGLGEPGNVLAPRVYPSVAEAAASPEAKQIQQVSIMLRAGDENAVKLAAAEMAPLVPKGSVLVPIPSKSGANVPLAQAIAQTQGVEATVANVLTREGGGGRSFTLRRAGQPGLAPEEIKMSGVLPPELQGRPVILVDNTVISGSTSQAARNALGVPDAQVLAYSRNPDVQLRAGIEAKLRAGQALTPEEAAFASDLIPGEVVALPPREAFSFEAMIDLWARERGIIFSKQLRAQGKFAGREKVVPYDLPLFKAQAAQRMLKQMDVWAQEMLSPTERHAFRGLEERWLKAAQDASSRVEDIAASKGFSIQRLDNGYIVARHVDGKAATVYASERAAKEGLMGVKLYGGDMADTFGVPPILSRGAGDGGAPTDIGPVDFLNPEGGLGKKLSRRAWFLLRKPPWARNRLDWLKDFEDFTNIPVWTKAGRHILDSVDTMERAVIKPSAFVEQTLRDFSTPEVYTLFNYIARTIGRGYKPEKLARIKAEMGVTSKMTEAHKFIELFDKGYTESVLKAPPTKGGLGLDLDMTYLEFYSRFLRPFMQHVGTYDEEALSKAFTSAFGKSMPDNLLAFSLKHFRGDLSIVDQDLRLILGKLIRDSLFDIHVQPTLSLLKPLTKINPITKRAGDPFQVSSLADAEREALFRRLAPGDNPEEGRRVLEASARLLGEQIAQLEGKLDLGPDIASGFISHMLGMFGVKAPERVIRTWVAVSMSNLHGSMLGLRPRVIARDWWQNYWNMGTRLGFDLAGESMAKALTREGYAEPFAEAATRVAQRGLPLAGSFDQIIEKIPIESIDGRNSIGAGVIKGLARLGMSARGASEKMLLPYSSQDQMLRSWAYWWQKMHTQQWLSKLENGLIKEPEFWEKGMPFFHATDKKQFKRFYDAGQREAALRYIAKTASNEANFVYGALAQPAWMQSNTGRLVGTFGTWPMWQTELYWRRLRMGTGKQRAAFIARSAAIATAIGVMGYETGTSIYNWMSPFNWFTWAGGPNLDLAFDAREMVTAPPERKVAAAGRFLSNFPRMAIPGQGFFARDLPQSLGAAARSGRPEYALYSVLIGRPHEVDGSYWAEALVNPEAELPRLTFRDAARARQASQNAEQYRQLQYGPIASPAQPPETIQSFGRRFPGLRSSPPPGAGPSPRPLSQFGSSPSEIEPTEFP